MTKGRRTTGNVDRSRTITFRLSVPLKERVFAEAKRREMTITSFVHEAFEEHVLRSARRRLRSIGVVLDPDAAIEGVPGINLLEGEDDG